MPTGESEAGNRCECALQIIVRKVPRRVQEVQVKLSIFFDASEVLLRSMLTLDLLALKLSSLKY